MEILKTILIVILVCLFWLSPIVLGVKTAKIKYISPYWMWFGINPVMGWIAYVFISSAKPRLKCNNCGEVLKSHAVVCAYCNIEIKQGNDTKITYNRKEKGNNKYKGLIIGITAFILFVLLVFTIISKSFTNSWAVINALEIANNNTLLSDFIGVPIKNGIFMTGSISISGNSGTADLIIPIYGNKGKGTLSVYAEKQDGEWNMLNLIFLDKKKTKSINLLE